MNNANYRAQRRAKKVRAKLFGSMKRPRLSVFRSNKAVSAQLIDDENQKTIMTFTQKGIDAKEKTTKTEAARVLGIELAKKVKEKKINAIIFDRGSYAYHGRVKAFAEGLREGGINF